MKKISRLRNFLQSSRGLRTAIFTLVLLNAAFYLFSDFISYPDVQRRGDASGFSYERAKQFAYFHYYTGHFPLATLEDSLQYSEEGARSQIKENGEDLIMEYEHWSRLGENARIWAFLPNAIASGSPKNPSIKLFNALVLVLSLIALYTGFYRIRKPLYGLLLVLLINLTPFYLYETYSNQNIFALLGSVFFLTAGLNMPFLFRKINPTRLLVTAVLSGAVVGFFSEFRNEVSIVFASVALAYCFAHHQKITVKILAILLAFGSFYGCKKGIQYHFSEKFEKTAKLVEKAGGHVYEGQRIPGHKFWHPVYCGLGDFDEKYGFEWNDKVAYRYATPILKEKYGMDIRYSGKYHLDNYYDKDSLYYVKFDEIEEYEEVVKDKVVSQIKEDPSWYLTII